MQIPALQPIQPTQQSHHNTPQTPIQFVVTSAKVHEHPSFSSVEEGKPQHQQQQQKQNRTTAVISTKPTNILHNYQSMPNPNQMPKAKEQLEQIEQQTEQLQTDQIQQQTQQLQIDQKQTTEQIEPQTPNEGDEVTAKQQQQQQQQLETLQSKIEPQSESNQTQDDEIDENVIPVLQQKPSQYSNPSVLFSTNSNLAPTIENPPSPQGNQTQPEDVKIVKIPNPSEQRPQSTVKHFLTTLELKNDGTQVVKVQVDNEPQQMTYMAFRRREIQDSDPISVPVNVYPHFKAALSKKTGSSNESSIDSLKYTEPPKVFNPVQPTTRPPNNQYPIFKAALPPNNNNNNNNTNNATKQRPMSPQAQRPAQNQNAPQNHNLANQPPTFPLSADSSKLNYIDVSKFLSSVNPTTRPPMNQYPIFKAALPPNNNNNNNATNNNATKQRPMSPQPPRPDQNQNAPQNYNKSQYQQNLNLKQRPTFPAYEGGQSLTYMEPPKVFTAVTPTRPPMNQYPVFKAALPPNNNLNNANQQPRPNQNQPPIQQPIQQLRPNQQPIQQLRPNQQPIQQPASPQQPRPNQNQQPIQPPHQQNLNPQAAMRSNNNRFSDVNNQVQQYVRRLTFLRHQMSDIETKKLQAAESERILTKNKFPCG